MSRIQPTQSTHIVTGGIRGGLEVSFALWSSRQAGSCSLRTSRGRNRHASTNTFSTDAPLTISLWLQAASPSPPCSSHRIAAAREEDTALLATAGGANEPMTATAVSNGLTSETK